MSRSSSLVRLALATVLTAAGPAAAQLAVTPPRLELAELARGAAVRVPNIAEHRLTIALTVRSWDLDETGQVRLRPTADSDLAQWMVVNPVRFELAGRPGATRHSPVVAAARDGRSYGWAVAARGPRSARRDPARVDTRGGRRARAFGHSHQRRLWRLTHARAGARCGPVRRQG